MENDTDATLALLAEMVNATDEALRRQAKQLATRLVIGRSRSGAPRRTGAGKLRTVPADRGGDLDVDGSVEALLEARAQHRMPSTEELSARDWARPELAVCLVVDASGSMNGARLSQAAMTAAATAYRVPGEYAVLSFARDVNTIRAISEVGSADAVVTSVLGLRGHGVTALAAALRAADEQLARSRAGRRVCVLLSDCRPTDEEDPVPVASRLGELVILAPAEDCDAAEQLARSCGARWAPMASASQAPDLLAELVG